MAQYYKPRENIVNDKIFDYFYLNPFNNYEEIYLVNDIDYTKLEKQLSLTNIVEVSSEGLINDNNPIYLNINRLTPVNVIYLKEPLDLLNNEEIVSFFQNFKGTFIANEKTIDFLHDTGILKEEYNINKNTYLIIDRYGKSEEKSLN